MSLRGIAREALTRARAVLPRRPRPAILMYHRIACESFDPWGLAVAPDRFARQLDWLAQQRTILSLEVFALRHHEGKLAPDAIAITFDDGYACTLSAAAPELDRLGLPATVFLPAALIEQDREFWWDELERIIIGFSGDALRLGETRIDLGPGAAADREWRPGAPPRTPRQLAFLELWQKLRTKPPAAIEAVIAELRAAAGLSGAPRPSHRPLSRDDITANRSANIAFGAHGLTHASLPHLDHASLEREISESAWRCASISGTIPRTFAYPFGDHDAQSEQLVEQANFICACATEQAAVTVDSPMFALPRLQVGNWEAARLALMLAAT